ncbi:UDP-N-acetylmuramate dehydrogenase [Glaciecola petra]|uniref:UDP-N-acetylenolpyruvoylglucosamine reductase n=1 Tax=Glaciecola petra TaxID=3075602 RepID=A0ABU2ZVK1_9ALTE|nr:UDP-N-acetylmuramate dehydrogenase [Aestuariibacter sp. P117]MDT0596667.1 UDP-N-acetylmuramate dehydrogenase [Aestuariibacter sp. P117]
MQSLKTHHTFSLNAHCRDIKTVNSADSLIAFSKAYSADSFLVLGEGSNTVFVDDFLSTIVLNKIRGIAINEDSTHYYLRVGAGENWHELVCLCMQKNIGGFENLALIPGTVGAAPIQNIGAYGVEIEKFIESVEYLDTADQTFKKMNRDACEFAYRGSTFKYQALNSRIITYVNFALPKQYELVCHYGPLRELQQNLPKDETVDAKKVFDEVIRIRQQKLPDVKVLGNAGSFFKNPEICKSDFVALQTKYPDMPSYNVDSSTVKVPAAWLIDYLGFKGQRNGDIACHKHQALVLVNLGNGSGEQLLALARNIRDSVQTHFEISLENEVRLMGSSGLVAL